MPFNIDREVGAAMAKLSPPGQEPPPKSALGDVESRRAVVTVMFQMFARPIPTEVSQKDFHVTASDGHKILLRWYTKRGSKATSAVHYSHGGGFIAGSVPLYDSIVSQYVYNTGVPFLSVEYRLAPEFQYPIPVSDAYAGLVWLHDHASDLGIDSKKIAIMGDSGGGGIAAALAHYALEKGGPSIAKQILIYPMLDDRNIKEDLHIGHFAFWNSVDNETGWTAMLGSKRGTASVSPLAAPARMTDATGLPPAYIETGELDIFRDEDIEYAAKFGRAGISVELHVHPGCPHGFEAMAPNSAVSKRAYADRHRVISSIEPLEQAEDAKL